MDVGNRDNAQIDVWDIRNSIAIFVWSTPCADGVGMTRVVTLLWLPLNLLSSNPDDSAV